jgi:hypothetical protein
MGDIHYMSHYQFAQSLGVSLDAAQGRQISENRREIQLFFQLAIFFYGPLLTEDLANKLPNVFQGGPSESEFLKALDYSLSHHRPHRMRIIKTGSLPIAVYVCPLFLIDCF